MPPPAWWGNVRELENALERAMLLTEDAYVGVADLPAELTGGNPEEAARRLGIDVSTLCRRLKTLGV
ncbi:MAG: helix-turn-helix domain-containing protein [Candidatus Eisenbacteria bacterium]